MSDASSHYTSAGNFISSMQGSVDPRTGLFRVQLPLMSVHGNAMMGPPLELKLSYSALSKVNYGFGNGFRLNLSQYDRNNGQLLLSTGEEYRVGSNYQVKQQKLKNFIFNKLNDRTCQIIHKSGLIEHLIERTNKIYVVSKIVSADGRTLNFVWHTFPPARLIAIKDDDQHVLCQINYPNNQSKITLFTVLPNNIERSYNIMFFIKNDFLTQIKNKAVDPELVWSFRYDDIGPQNRYRSITEINTPSGLIEKVWYYADEGMDFPEIAKLPPLPCVHRHIIIPGENQPNIITEWNYTRKNYLGKDANFNMWHPDTDQMLNIFIINNQYGSTEQHMDSNGRVLCRVTRRYNCYHLLEFEMTNRNGKVHTKSTEYYAKPGVKFDDQPAQYALPKIKTECWSESDKNGTMLKRTIQIRYEFDENGNPIREESPDGTVTEFTYYPSNGEENKCPADPHGFVRYQKMQTITPPQKTGNEFISSTSYKWQKLDALNGDGYAVVQKSNEQTTAKKRKLTQNLYYTDHRIPLLYGRIMCQQMTLTPDITQTETFTTTNRLDYRITLTELIEESKFIGHDGLIATATIAHDLWTKKLLSETTCQGIETRYDYDKIGRLKCQTLCPNSEYEIANTWDYKISKSNSYTIETDAVGNKIKTHFDCIGRIVSRYTFNADTAIWYETYSSEYNSLGEPISSTVDDWLIDGSKRFPLMSSITYDGWGEKSMVSFSNNKIEHQQIDNTHLIHTSFAEGIAIDGQHMIGGSEIKEYDNVSGQLMSKTLKTTCGEEYSCCQYTWDGLGHLLEEQDELGRSTKRTYDEYGRVLRQTLPDDSIVSQTYAPHLTGKQIASISVIGTDATGATRTWLIGTQKFDSLGRLTERISGGRTTSYIYEGSSSKPSIVTLPSGKVLNYIYISELDDAISSMATDGIVQNYTYDKKTRKLLAAKESNSEIQYTWSKNGHLISETILNDGTTKLAEYNQTLNNVPVEYTDVSGKVIQYEMNSHGQVIRITDHNITVDLTYDALARISTKVVHDKNSSSSLTTDLNYDDFGNEIMRTITDQREMKLIVSQAWKKNGLLSKRTTEKNGVIIQEEQYDYDNRNRLIRYKSSGNILPTDSYGHQMIGQTYEFDALNNLCNVTTIMNDATVNVASYHYENENDPTQLTRVINTHNGYPANINLIYDSDGRMICDEAGRMLTYDAIGRLKSVTENNICKSTYHYDAMNRLITQKCDENDIRQLYYRGAELVNEMPTLKQKETRFIKFGHNCLAVSDKDSLTLTATDKNDCLLWSTDGNDQIHTWSPYGSGSSNNKQLLGFNGERIDPLTGMYHLGNGYRAYNPVLMRFNCPDSLSPFEEGGINAYTYCSGDPINHTDPSGHLSWQAITGIVLGAIGIGLAIFTAGSSIAAAGGVMAAISSTSVTSITLETLSVISDVTGITSGVIEDVAPNASNAIGWLSTLLGFRISKFKKAAEIEENIAHIPWNFIRRNSGIPIKKRLRFFRKPLKLNIRRQKIKLFLKIHHQSEILAKYYGRISPVIDGVLRFIPSNEIDTIISTGKFGVNLFRNSYGESNENIHYHEEHLNDALQYEHSSKAKIEHFHTKSNHDILDFCYERNDKVLRNMLNLS